VGPMTILFFCATLLAQSQAADTATPRGVVAGSVPGALLFIRNAPEMGLGEIEGRLASDLGLVLDGFATFSVEAPTPEFWHVGLAGQISMLTPLVTQYGSAAVGWLSPGPANAYLLHLVVIQSGRTLVRTFEARRAATMNTLALAVRELLGTAYLFDEPPPEIASAMAPVVGQVRQQVAQSTEQAMAPPERRWRVLAASSVAGGGTGHEGPRLLAGGSIGGEGQIGRFLFGLEGEALWQSSHTAGLTLRRQSLRPRVRVAYGVEEGPFSIAPELGAAIVLEHGTLSGPAATQGFTDTGTLISVGLQLRWRSLTDIALFVQPRLSYDAAPMVLLRRSTDEVVLRSSPWELSLALGVALGS
jgi:hypothetical protein